MITDAQKADVRRHLGYGPMGNLTYLAGSMASYRFFVHHGLLEFRMNYLSAEEEAILLGGIDPDAPTNPNFIDPATDIVYQGYLPICNFLEGQIAVSTDSFDIQKAGSYESRPDEMNWRISLYNYWRTKLADFMYLPINQDKFNSTAPKVRLVV